MNYFIAWVILMLAAILAVPIVSMMEKRKLEGPRKKKSDDEAAVDDGDEALQPLAEGEEQSIEEGASEESEAIPDDAFGAGAADDFSAFEEEFK